MCTCVKCYHSGLHHFTPIHPQENAYLKEEYRGDGRWFQLHQSLLKEGWHLAGNSHKNICHLTSKCKIIRKGQQGLEANKLLQN